MDNDEIVVGDQLVLEGLSSYGKDVIAKHGEVWDVTETTFLNNMTHYFILWSNDAYEGDWQPLHMHGSQTPAGLSGFAYLGNKICCRCDRSGFFFYCN